MSQSKNRYQAERWLLTACYPNGLPDLTPGQVYRLHDASRGIEAARTLVADCRKWLEQQ